MKQLFSLALLSLLFTADSCMGQNRGKPRQGQIDSTLTRPPSAANPPVLRPDTHQTTPMPTMKPDSTKTNMPVVKPQPGVQPK